MVLMNTRNSLIKKSRITLRATGIRMIRDSSISEHDPTFGWLVETMHSSIRISGLEAIIIDIVVSAVVCSRTRHRAESEDSTICLFTPLQRGLTILNFKPVKKYRRTNCKAIRPFFSIRFFARVHYSTG